jgi:hypothetical protein
MSATMAGCMPVCTPISIRQLGAQLSTMNQLPIYPAANMMELTRAGNSGIGDGRSTGG